VNRAYLILLGLSVLDAAGYSVVAPALPTIADATGAGPAVVGGLVATFPVGIIVGFVAAGSWIREGRLQLLLLVSLVVLAAGAFAFAVVDTLPAWIATRFVMGVGSGGLWMGIAFSTLARWPDQAYVCMSRIAAAYSVGGLVGPLLGAFGGVRGPFLAFFGLVLIGGVLAAGLGPTPARSSFTSDRAALRLSVFRFAGAAVLFAVLGVSMIEGVLPLHLATGLTQTGIGLVLATTSIVVAISATLASRLRPRLATLAALVPASVGIGIAAAAGVGPLTIVGLGIAAIGIGLASTGSIGILLEGIPASRSVTAFIVWSQLGIFGYLLGPILGGAAAQAFGFGALGLVMVLAAIPVIGMAELGRGPRTADP
jgi:MFS family permease